MRNKTEWNKGLFRRIATIFFLAVLSSGCVDMVRQGGTGPAAGPSTASESVMRDEQLNLYKEKGKDYVLHRVRQGETLSGIAMAYYGTYLTDVFYHIPRRQFMTQDVSPSAEADAVRRMGKVSDVIARLNELESSQLKVGSDVILPRIQGLPFHKEKPKPVKTVPEIKASTTQSPEAAAEPRPKEQTAAQTEAAFQDLLSEGRRHYEKERYAAAIVPFSAAHRLQPQDAVVRDYLYRSYAALGEKALKEKDYLRAARAFETALSYNPACEECREKMAASEERYNVFQ